MPGSRQSFSTTVRGHPADQDHNHQEQACSLVSCRSGENVQDVRHGTENHSTAPEPEIEGSGKAPCGQVRPAAVADTCGHKSLIAYTIKYKVGDAYFERTTSVSTTVTVCVTGAPSDSLLWTEHPQPMMGRSFQCLSVGRLCISATHQERWLRSMQAWSLVHPVHCLLPHSLDCHQGVALKSRFSVTGSEAGYSDTVDGDYSDFGEAYGVYRSCASYWERLLISSHPPFAEAAQDLFFFRVTRQR